MYHGSKDSKGSLPVNPPIYFRLLFTGWWSDFCLSVMIQVTIILYIDKRHQSQYNQQTCKSADCPWVKSLDLSQLLNCQVVPPARQTMTVLLPCSCVAQWLLYALRTTLRTRWNLQIGFAVAKCYSPFKFLEHPHKNDEIPLCISVTTT